MVENPQTSDHHIMVKVNKDLISETGYYSILRFGMMIKDKLYLMVDESMVNWLEKLTQNQKSRLLISGIGTELMYEVVSQPQLSKPVYTKFA